MVADVYVQLSLLNSTNHKIIAEHCAGFVFSAKVHDVTH